MHLVIMSRWAPAGRLCDPVDSSMSRSAQLSNVWLMRSQAALSAAGGNAMRGKHSMVGTGSAAVCTNSLSAMTLCRDGGPCETGAWEAPASAESGLQPFVGANGAVGATFGLSSCLAGVHSLSRCGASGRWGQKVDLCLVM